MKRVGCVAEARHVLSESFGVVPSDCDRVLRAWSEQTNAPLAKVADVLVHQIWHGEDASHDRALVRSLEECIRRLPAHRSADGPEAIHQPEVPLAPTS